MTEQRIEKIREILIAEKLDVIIIFGLINIRYLCGFTGTDGVLLITATEAFFLTDSRYIEQAQTEALADRVECYTNKLQALSVHIKSLVQSAKIGFDSDSISVAVFDELRTLEGTAAIRWVPLSKQLESLRGIKERDELNSLKLAADLNHQAFTDALPRIRSGVTEREIALELEFALKRLGGEDNSFDFIVASGQRGALPHGVASNKVISNGDLVTIDFGTKVKGYHSDETVTLAVGDIDGKLRQIFDIVLEAHDSALSQVRPGLEVCNLDAFARNYIASKGYGEYFGHSLGHGVGLDVHEFPPVSSRSAVMLEEGMVITIEPGIYIPGTGGVRIEDTVAVTACGYEVLTSIPKQFRQLDQ